MYGHEEGNGVSCWLITAKITTTKGKYTINQSTSPVQLEQEGTFEDPLTHMLRLGPRQLIAQAVEAELESFLAEYSAKKIEDGRSAIVRNGYLPGRTVQTGLGDVGVKVPKVGDRSGSGIKFNSNFRPPDLKRLFYDTIS